MRWTYALLGELFNFLLINVFKNLEENYILLNPNRDGRLKGVPWRN
jgi:hypothetical protein